MFLVNSRLGLFSAAFFRRHPFSLSYGVILPSSLTTLLPSAFGFSPHLPVSVSGTGYGKSIAAFLDSLNSGASLLLFGPPHVSPQTRGFSSSPRLLACTGLPIPGSPYPPVSPHFCLPSVQDSPPVLHRLRLSTSP